MKMLPDKEKTTDKKEGVPHPCDDALHQHDKKHLDEIADEWGDESFPASDPPGSY